MMKRLVITAIATLALTTGASAGDWSDGYSNDGPNWNQLFGMFMHWMHENGHLNGWGDLGGVCEIPQDGWDWQGCAPGWGHLGGQDCPDDNQPQDPCDGKDNEKDCAPPTGIPSPTAAFAGLALMGVLATRRQRRA